MDSRSGRCWVCDATGRLWCSACRFALYCSLACQKKDRLRHLDECVNSSRRRVCCNYCGREEALGGVPCPECVVATYCTDSCRKIDAKNHRSVCLQAKQKVVEAAKKINEWNRRAKGIPQYLGRLIHAVDYLRWSENEGARILAATHSPQHKEQTSDSGSEASKDSRNGRKENGLAQEMLRLLLLGADLKHVLCILHDTPDACTQPLEMVLVDSSPHILARDLLILYLLMLPDAHDPLQDPALVQAHAEKVVMVFYSLCLDMETHALLCNTLHNLLNMTHKTFLQEMRQQVLVDAGTYTLVQSVWSGWMSFANDPSALQKLENVRTLKVSGKMIKEVLARYIKSCPREHHKAVTDWIKRGSMKKSRGGNFPNVTLACFSPLRREYLEKFEDVSPKWSEETEWIKAVTVDDDMIYAPHGIDMIFQDWDFLILSRNVKKESNVVEMYRIYLTQVFSRASYKLLRSSQVLITFIRADVRELAANTALLKGKFDRIATGIHADLLGTPYVLQHFGGFLRTDNMYSRLLTHHRVWSLCLDWRSDQQARETCLKSLKCNRAPDPLLMITGRWATFRHFLQAELLHHLHVLDGRPLEPENVLVFKNVSHAYDMVLSDYTRQLNHIVPFRFQADKRMVSMVDSRLHTLEWRRLARTRRASAPAATNPAPKSLPTSPNHDIDPASRYVDNLIFLSQNPSSASPTSDSSLRRSINRREGSRSPSTVEPSSTSDDRPSRPRTSNRMRPRSLYVSTRCKSPLLSPEFDFWEHHNLIKEKKTPTSRAYNEIPEGISRRIQQALQGDTKQEKVATKSAPVSPELTRKTKVVKEKANAFERGTVARSTFPETRKTVETVTPSTPVKKLVSMFSKAFAAKDKEIDAGRKFKRSNSLHDSCLTPEEQNEIQNKSYNSLRITRSKSRTQRNGEINEAVECGMSTFPRRARPHSVASSKFSYLEGGTAKDTQASSPVSSSDQKYDLKKTLAVDTSDSPRNKKGHISPIRSLFAGLNTLSMSPILQRAADRQHSTPLKEELRLVHLRPVSQRFQSPPSLSLSSDNTDTMNLPESSSTRPNNDTPDTNNSARRRSSFDYLTDKKEPHSRKLPSPPWKSALKQTPKKIPHEPEYVAPSLHVNKEVGPLQSPTPDSNQSPSEAAVIEPETKLKVGMLITSKSEAASDLSDTQKENLPENIFSPRSSPNLYQPKNEESHRSAEKESCLMMEAQQLDEDDTISTSKSDSTTPSSPTKREPEKEDSTGWEEDLFAVIEETNVKKQNLVSQEDFTLLTSASLSSSLTDADMEVSELLSHQEQFCPIKDLKTDTEDESKSLILNQEEEKYTDLETERAQNAKDIQEKIKENFPVKDNTEPIDICKISAEEDIEKELIDIDSASQSPSTDMAEPRTPSVCRMIEHFAQRIQEQQALLERPPSPKRDTVRKTFLHQTFKEMCSGLKDITDPAPQSPEVSSGLATDKPFQKNIELIPETEDTFHESTPEPSLHPKDDDIKDEDTLNIKADVGGDITPEPLSSTLSLSLPATPVTELSTPVNKMVEQFDQHIQALSLPTSPTSSRPNSIGSLIQQDLMRLYPPKQGDPRSKGDPIQKSPSVADDCFERKMLEVTEVQKEKTEDKSFDANKNIPPNQEIADNDVDIEATVKMGNKICVKPIRTARKTRQSVCDELRHEFLQKIRSLDDDLRSLEKKKKYEERRSALQDKRKSIQHGEKTATEEGANVQSSCSEPQAEDMTVLTYTVQVDTVQIKDDSESFTVSSIHDPTIVLPFAADKGGHRDSRQLTLLESQIQNNSKASEDSTLTPPFSPRPMTPPLFPPALTLPLSPRALTPPISPLTYTERRDTKDDSKDSSPYTAPQRKLVRQITQTESSQRMPILKSSKTGGFDKISFRNYVKSSIANEDLALETEQESTCAMEHDTKVVEYTSSFEVSTDEFRADPESVEEAVEAISFLSSDDHSRNKLGQRLILYSNESEAEDQSCAAKCQSLENKQHKYYPGRKRLVKLYSPSDVQHDEHSFYPASPRSSPSSCDGKDRECSDSLTAWQDDSESFVIRGRAQASQLSQLHMKHVDEIKRCRQSDEKEESKYGTFYIPTETSKDKQRFTWGSLRKKKKDFPKIKKEESKPSDICHIKEDSSQSKTQSEKVNKGMAYNFFFDRKKNKLENEPSLGSPDNTRGDLPSDNKMSESPGKGNTLPTIVSVFPKQRESEIPDVDSRFGRERQSYRSKTTPETKLSPKKRIPFHRDSSSPSDNFSQTLLRLIAPTFEDKHLHSGSEDNTSAPVETHEVNQVGEENYSPENTPTMSERNMDPWVRRDLQDSAADSASLLDDSEVFTNDAPSSNDENSQMNHNGGVEVRPLAGVLKSGRDHSRDSRRSLRVSWGDLPDRMDSPSQFSDAEDHNDENNDDEHEQDENLQTPGPDKQDDKAYRVTQL